MRSPLGRPSKKACLLLTRFLVVVLLFLSSRNTALTRLSLSYDWKRPRPSRQSLPTPPDRPTADSSLDRHRDFEPPGDLVEPTPSPGTPGVLSRASHQHLRAEITKPDYLQFFRGTGVPNHLSPPG